MEDLREMDQEKAVGLISVAVAAPRLGIRVEEEIGSPRFSLNAYSMRAYRPTIRSPIIYLMVL